MFEIVHGQKRAYNLAILSVTTAGIMQVEIVQVEIVRGQKY